MARVTTNYRCTECGASSIKWVGRCGECQSWGTVIDQAETVGLAPRGVTPLKIPDARGARPITEIGAESVAHWPSGIAEFDRVLGGGNPPTDDSAN